MSFVNFSCTSLVRRRRLLRNLAGTLKIFVGSTFSSLLCVSMSSVCDVVLLEASAGVESTPTCVLVAGSEDSERFASVDMNVFSKLRLDFSRASLSIFTLSVLRGDLSLFLLSSVVGIDDTDVVFLLSCIGDGIAVCLSFLGAILSELARKEANTWSRCFLNNGSVVSVLLSSQ